MCEAPLRRGDDEDQLPIESNAWHLVPFYGCVLERHWSTLTTLKHIIFIFYYACSHFSASLPRPL